LNPTLILVRHGETALNTERRIRGWMDVHINEDTKAVIARTASRLSLFPLHNPLVSSDLTRAKETAEIIADDNFLEIELDERWRPWDVGFMTGMKLEEVIPAMNRYIDNPREEVPGGESFNKFFLRVKDAFREEVAAVVAQPEEVRVVVTHSRNIEAVRYFVTGDKKTLVQANSVAPGCATSWQIISGKLVEILVGDPASHEEKRDVEPANPES